MTEKKRKPIKALFIDVIKEEVREIILQDGGQWRPEMFRLLSLPDKPPCSDINVIRLDEERHYIHVDGEGMLRDPLLFFLWKRYGNPLAGHGIIHRVDDEGDSVDVRLKIDEVRRHIKFAKMRVLGFVQKTEAAEIFGKPGIRITKRPVLQEYSEPGKGPAISMEEIAEHMGVPVESLQWTTIEEAEGADKADTDQTEEDSE